MTDRYVPPQWSSVPDWQRIVAGAVNGLGNVDNTSDADKPVSTATQAALDDKLTAVDGNADWPGYKEHDNDTGFAVVSSGGAGSALTTFGSVGGAYGQNNGATQWWSIGGDLNGSNHFPIDGSHPFQFTTPPFLGTLTNAANDAAAAAAGVAVGGLYRNGSVVMIRVA